MHDVLRPALDAGEVVVTDRFVDSSLAYQGAGRTIPLDEIRTLSRWATGPVSVVASPGDHRTMLRAPHASTLGTRIAHAVADTPVHSR